MDKSLIITRMKIWWATKNKSYTELSSEIGLDWSATDWSRFMRSNREDAATDGEYIKMYAYLKDNYFIDETSENIKKVLEASPDDMYFSLLNFFGYKYETEQETKNLASGLYTLYRPSLKIPNMFTKGLVEITVDEKSHALKVKESRVFKGSKKVIIDEISGEKIVEEKGIKEFFEGYMIRKRRRYVCVQKSMTKDSPNFVISIYNDEFVDNEGKDAKILSLGGIVFGTVGARIYASRVFLERCDEGSDREELIKNLDYVDKNSLKPSVRNYLKLSNPQKYSFVF